jgi:type I restriction enzyme S subunit
MELTLQKYKQTEVGLIPEIWEVKTLREIGDAKMCKRIFSYQTTERGDVPFFKIGTFGKEPDAYISNNIYTEYRKKFSFPSKGSILISAAGTIGRIVVYNGEDSYFQDSNIVWVDNNEKLLTNEYLKHVFPKIIFKTEGGTIQRLYNNILLSGYFPLPPTLEEQKVIATALSDVDELIINLDQLITKKKAIKQGAMQQLLTPPHKGGKRLEGFFGEWDYKTVGELCKTFTKQTGFDYSNHIKPTLINKKQTGHLPFIQNKDFNGHKVNFDTDYYIPQDVAVRFPMILLNERCLMISISGSIGKVGVFNNKEMAFIGGAVSVGKFNNPVYLDWVMNYLQSEAGQNMMLKDVKAGSHQNLILDDIRKMKIPMPKIEEQNAVCQILSDIDLDLEKLETKKAKYQNIKQGMMQELLTGKTRLV